MSSSSNYEDEADIPTCMRRMKQAIDQKKAKEATVQYFRAMLRSRQDAWCTHEPQSAYGALRRIHRRLMWMMRFLMQVAPSDGEVEEAKEAIKKEEKIVDPDADVDDKAIAREKERERHERNTSVDEARSLDLAAIQLEQVEWLKEVCRQRNRVSEDDDEIDFPSPIWLVKTYSDMAVGYDREERADRRKRRKLQENEEEHVEQHGNGQEEATKEEEKDEKKPRRICMYPPEQWIARRNAFLESGIVFE